MHVEHSEADARERVPARQGVHTAELEVEEEPASHGLHSVELEEEKEPAEHWLHSEAEAAE